MNTSVALSRAVSRNASPTTASLDASASLFGRVGLSLVFIISGWGKIAAYAGTQQYMEAAGVPGALLPLVIALALAAFSLASAALFHADFGDAAQAINFWKNVAMAGGFLMLAAHGAGAISLDHAWARHRVA